MTACINLLERFGDRYRIGWDEAYDPKGKHRESLDPWYMQVVCQRGFIYPYGGTRLVAEVDRRAVTAQRLRALSCCRPLQSGEQETAFLFDVADFDTVARVMLPRRRRQISEANRAKARERMQARHGKFPSPEASQAART